MSDLPRGTVTLLFTDIEASTQLLKTLGEGYERALSDHRVLLRRAFNLAGGQVVDRQGDSFFVVFRRAKDALTAAVEAQRALPSHPWPDGVRLRVRMGIHTGEPAVNDEGLTGLAVHRAARICSAASGEQVLVSSTTREVVEGELPAGTELRDLGTYALKDFDRPAHLFQVVADGLRESVSVVTGANEAVGPPPAAGSDEHDVAGPQRRASRWPRGLGIRVTPSPGISRALDAMIPRPIRRRLGNDPIVIGSRIQSMSRLSPAPEFAAALRGLGGAVIQVARCHRDTQRTLQATDLRALRRRLDSLRSDPFLSKQEASLADHLAKKAEPIDELAKLRPVLRAEIVRVRGQAEELRDEVFRLRMGRPPTSGLVEALNAQCDSIQSLCTRAREAERNARDAAPSPASLGNS
jgi:class 3 adenylate cyclase